MNSRDIVVINSNEYVLKSAVYQVGAQICSCARKAIGFEPRRTSRTLRLKSDGLTPQMGIFQRQLKEE